MKELNQLLCLYSSHDARKKTMSLNALFVCVVRQVSRRRWCVFSLQHGFFCADDFDLKIVATTAFLLYFYSTAVLLYPPPLKTFSKPSAATYCLKMLRSAKWNAALPTHSSRMVYFYSPPQKTTCTDRVPKNKTNDLFRKS